MSKEKSLNCAEVCFAFFLSARVEDEVVKRQSKTLEARWQSVHLRLSRVHFRSSSSVVLELTESRLQEDNLLYPIKII